jgi:hypothetical protein
VLSETATEQEFALCEQAFRTRMGLKCRQAARQLDRAMTAWLAFREVEVQSQSAWTGQAEQGMHFELSVDVEAPAATTWRAVTQIEDWPRWAASMQAVRWLDGAAVCEGARAWVKQPGMPPVVWTVSEYEEGATFTWVARSLGILTVAAHFVRTLSADRSRLTLRIDQTGLFAPLVEGLMGARTRRFVGLECEGLKRAAEALRPVGGA